jgi:hypothetical protein
LGESNEKLSDNYLTAIFDCMPDSTGAPSGGIPRRVAGFLRASDFFMIFFIDAGL